MSLSQLLTLLRAIEDLQAVHPRVRSECVELLRSTLAAADGSGGKVDARDMMKKSISELTASTNFSFVGDSMIGSGQGMGSDRKKRGWDWHKGLKAGDGAEHIIAMLRLGLAREVSRAWMEGEEM